MPTANDLKRTYPCRCGSAHVSIARVGGTCVLECPVYDGDLDLMLVNGVPFFVKGTGAIRALLLDVNGVVSDLSASIDRETKKKKA